MLSSKFNADEQTLKAKNVLLELLLAAEKNAISMKYRDKNDAENRSPEELEKINKPTKEIEKFIKCVPNKKFKEIFQFFIETAPKSTPHTLMEGLELLIKSIPGEKFKEIFQLFIEAAPEHLPHRLVEGFKLFLQHHIKTPAQILKEFAWILPEVIKKNRLLEFSTACDLISRPHMALMSTPDDQKQDENLEIKNAVNHGASFSKKWVELQPLFNGKFGKPSPAVTDKKDKTTILDQGEKYKLMREWLLLFNAASDFTNKLEIDESLKEALLKTENWLRLLNFFSAKIGFNNGSDIEYLFRALRGHPTVSATDYLIELIKQCGMLGKPAETRQRIIQSFFHINQSIILEHPESIDPIFSKLYENQLHGMKADSKSLCSIVDDIIKTFSIKPSKALMPLIVTLKEIQSRPKLFHHQYNAFVSALESAMHLITRPDINPFEATQAGQKSFFAEILIQWQSYREHKLLEQTGEFVPHYYQSDDGNIHCYYQINIACRDQMETFTHTVLWSELFPLLKDEKQFVEHFQNLFGNDINLQEVLAIRNNLIENNSTIKLNNEHATVLQSAVLHKLNSLDVDIESKELNFADTILRLLNKKTMYICNNQFDAKSQRSVLAKTDEVTNSSGLAQGTIPFLLENNQYYLLIPALTVIGNQNIKTKLPLNEIKGRVDFLKMQYLLEGFVRVLFNMANFSHANIYQHIQCIPEMLCRLRGDSREILLQHMLGNEKSDQTGESKQELKMDLDPHQPHHLRSTVIFRSIALYEITDEEMQKRFNVAKGHIIQKYKNKYNNHPYFLLLANNVHPLFYEGLKHKLSKQFVLKHIDNEDFQKLYQTHIKKKVPSEFDLVRLLDIAVNNKNLIDHVMLKTLVKLYVNMTNEATQSGIYVILRSHIITFDKASSDVSLFKNILALLTNIFERLNPNDDNSSCFKTVTGILRENPLLGLSTLIQEMKTSHPLIEDVEEVIPDLLKKNNPTALLRFTENLNKNKLTYRLTEPKYQDLLAGILTNIASVEVKNDDSAKIIPALTQKNNDAKSRINFNTPRASGESWLEFAWNNQQIRNVLQLIQADADVSVLFGQEHKAFSLVFLEFITANVMSLQDANYLEIMKILMTKNLEVVYVWLKTLKTETLSTLLQTLSDNTLLKQIALHSITADRFDLLKLTNERVRQLTQQDAWSHQGQMQADFDKTFRKVLRIPDDAKYQSFMDYPSFYTCYHLIPIFYQGKYELPLLEIGLSTKNEAMSVADKAKEYFDNLTLLYDKHHTCWKLTDNTRGLIDVIINALKRSATVLSLQDIITLSASTTALQIPAIYPIENTLSTLFAETKPGDWISNVNGLHNKFLIFKIKGTPPETVKKQFIECKPSFNDVVSKGSLFSLSKHDPIEYFFKIFGNVTEMLTSHKETKESPLDIYKTSQPFKWNEYEDTRFMGALCQTSETLLQKTPYHAQFVTIMGTMYAIPDVKKLLVDVASGQGKTLVIAFTAVCIMKHYPDTTLMPILTLTSHLAKDNAAENKPFYDYFGITSCHTFRDDTGEYIYYNKAIIQYTTSRCLLFKMVDQAVSQTTSDFTQARDKTHWKLIIDETDIDLSARKDAYMSALGCDFPEMSPVLRFIWEHRNDKFPDARYYLTHYAGYKSLSIDLQNHVSDNFEHFHNTAQTVAWYTSNTNSMGAMTTFELSTGIKAANTHGANGAPQFHQLKAYGSIQTDFQLPHYAMYYSDMIHQFKMIIGFSGTLGGELEQKEYKKDGFATVATARFNAKNLKEEPPQLCETELEWKEALVQKTKIFLSEGRPVLLFVKKPEDVGPLEAHLKTHLLESKHCLKLNTMLGDEKHQDYRRIVQEATEMGTVTIAAMIGGRGVDYQMHNDVIDKKGGLVVITATIVEFENAELQIKARTARGDNQGLALAIYLKSELTTMLVNAGVSYEKLDATTLPTILKEMREKMLKDRFDTLDRDKKNNLRVQLSKDFWETVIPDEKSRETRFSHYRNRFVFLYHDAGYATTATEQAKVKANYRSTFKASKI